MTTVTLAAGETKALSKRHQFKKLTTRVHHPGLHSLELQINGVRHARTDFLVEL
jgi:hypothetical protein